MNWPNEATFFRYYLAEGFDISDVRCESCGSVFAIAHYPNATEETKFDCIVCENKTALIIAPIPVNANGERV